MGTEQEQTSDVRPELDEFIAELEAVDLGDAARPFDMLMFDVCGEANHVRHAYEEGRDALADALSAFDRACLRIYRDPEVSMQRKSSLRTAEWILKSWCLWEAGDVSGDTATRWFDAWQHERNRELIEF